VADQGVLLQLIDFDATIALGILTMAEMSEFGGVDTAGELSLLDRSVHEARQQILDGKLAPVPSLRSKAGPYARVLYTTEIDGNSRTLMMTNDGSRKSVAVSLIGMGENKYRVTAWRPVGR